MLKCRLFDRLKYNRIHCSHKREKKKEFPLKCNKLQRLLDYNVEDRFHSSLLVPAAQEEESGTAMAQTTKQLVAMV